MGEGENWFIGLPVSSAGWFERLPPPPSSFRLFAPTDLHLTIAFLGGVTEEAARAAWAATSWTGPPIEMTFGAIVPMGPARRWSALSALVVEGRDEIEAGIARSRDPICAAAGVKPDERPPKAHITLGRPTRKASDDERAASRAWAEAIVLPTERVGLATIALYTWSDDRKKNLFRIVEQSGLPRIA